MVSEPAWDLYSPSAELIEDDALIEDESSDDEQWHVLMGPGQVKVLSLEQLDDFFRLDVIGESTFVWQEGMKDWAPLSIVAGLDHEGEKPTEPLGFPPPLAPAPMPMSVPAPAPSAQPAFVPAPRSVAPAASVAPAGSVRGSVAPAGSVAPPASWAPSVAPVGGFADSLQPTTFDDVVPKEKANASRWPIVVAAVCGILLTMYRNDVMRDAAQAAGQSAAYEQLEAVIGPPGFGTPRSVATETPAEGEADAAANAPAEQAPGDVAPHAEDSESDSAQAEAKPDEPAASAKDSQDTAAAVKPPSRTAAPRATSPRTKTPAKTPIKKTKGRNSEYDPMNAAL